LEAIGTGALIGFIVIPLITCLACIGIIVYAWLTCCKKGDGKGGNQKDLENQESEAADKEGEKENEEMDKAGGTPGDGE